MTETKFTKSECDKYLLDSCLLIYFADRSDSNKYELAAKWIENQENTFYISTQNLREFANICLLKKILPSEGIVEFLDSFTARFRVIQDDQLDTKNAVVLCKGNQKLFWDASIVSVMKRNGIDCILTENTKDFEALGVRVINPLK